MSLPTIEINLTNGALGLAIPTDDGLTGLILQGPAPTGLALLTPKLITSLEDAEALGIDEAYDSTNSVRVHAPIKEFYTEGEAGLRLWIMIVSQTVLAEDIMDKTEANYAVKLLDAAQGGIRMLGLVRSPDGGYSPNVAANHIDIDIVNALTNAQALAEEYRGKIQPVQIVLEGYAYDGNFGGLIDLKTLTHSNVAVLIGGTTSGPGAAIGIMLGRAASVPVQRNIGRVKDGALTLNDIYLGTTVFADAISSAGTIHDKGFITFRQHNGKGGFYFSSDPTATSATDDYNRWARGRVINKVVTIAYAVFVEEILDEIKVNAGGQISTAKAKYYQSVVDTQVNQIMTANDEISSFRSFVDPEQNVIAAGNVCIELRVRPVGYADNFLIKLGFEI